MENSNYSRRNFIKGSIGTGLLVAGSGLLPSCSIFRMSSKSGSDYDAKGLPTAILGKTGVRIPRIAIGLGSRFCTIKSNEEAYQLLNFALDNGLYYWDTAWAYENTSLGITSEERLGEVVKTRRNEIFLSSKVASRNPDEAMRQIESSLKRLKTDHLDMLKIHDVQTEADVAKLSEKAGLIEILMKLKEQGITRFIGFSGHTEALAMKMMAEKGVFDSMLMAMNHWNMATNQEKRQELAIPAAKAQGMGVMLMKVIRPRETIKELDPRDLVRYALSLKEPNGIVLGMDSQEVVKSNLEILKNFKPMDEAKMKQMAMQLTPFHKHENLPWMNPDYCDGHWA
ncbi:MAG TPA: aldo/keto reductase [Prolixibacteraceae bacterium]|nr:aldo/keto reductase [Prolixibacteraceae bacterium]